MKNIILLLSVFLLIVAFMVIFSSKEVQYLPKLLVVQTGSMRPAIKEGSMVFVVRKNIYYKGDIITFQNVDIDDDRTIVSYVTHRISEVENDFYITKGDANNSEDFGEVKKDQVVGKVLFSVPYLGYYISFAKTRLGFVISLLLPAVVLILIELSNIKNEIVRIGKEKKIKKQNKTKDMGVSKEKHVVETEDKEKNEKDSK